MKSVFIIFDNLWNCIESVHETIESAESALSEIKNDSINQDYSIDEWTVLNTL